MYKKVLLIFCVMILAVSCSQNTKKKSGQELNSTSTPVGSSGTVGHDHSEDEVNAGADTVVKSSISVVLTDDIKRVYKGVTVADFDKKTGKEVAKVDVPFKDRTALKSTPLAIEVESYFTSFTMDNTGVINKSMEESNPATKVKIYKNNELVFDGWLFQNFPDTHQFEDPDFTLLLVKGNKK